MCRRTIIHQMHHDVRRPMIIDPMISNAPIYANPRHTSHHVCELTLPIPGQWLLNSKPSCQYHSCCIPISEVEYCADLEWHLADSGSDSDYDDILIPEECEYYVLMHKHVRISYLGNDSAYTEEYPATWDYLEELSPDWLPWFAHDERFLVKWEEGFYFECERLYTLERDVQIQSQVVMDLSQTCSLWDRRRVYAERRLLQAEGELNQQRAVIFGLTDWAREPCSTC
ncbi:hypothetical protein F5B20DRAFT_583435 [Whalleya microplaca]|nr:hypothetical protein F5B20DRAFT_583435 [Whalleya microplaca]